KYSPVFAEARRGQRAGRACRLAGSGLEEGARRGLCSISRLCFKSFPRRSSASILPPKGPSIHISGELWAEAILKWWRVWFSFDSERRAVKIETLVPVGVRISRSMSWALRSRLTRELG